MLVALGISMQWSCATLSCPAVQYFSTRSHKRSHFRRKLLVIKRVFLFPVQILSETFLFLRRVERDMIVNIYWFLCKSPVILVRFFWQILRKYSNVTFHENSSSGSRVVPCGQTDGRKEDRRMDMEKLIAAFGSFVKAPENCSLAALGTRQFLSQYI